MIVEAILYLEKDNYGDDSRILSLFGTMTDKVLKIFQ